MARGAHTPEELETLLEDAFVTRDAGVLPWMFDEGAVLAVGKGPEAARGAEEIAHLARVLWEGDRIYVADPRRVVQARDTALVLADRAINVVRRGSDGAWRYAIALLSFEPTTKEDS